MNTINTRVSCICIDENNISRVNINENAEVDLADAEEIISTILKIRGGEILPVCIDIRKLKSISREARQYFASDDRPRVGNAVALVVESSTTRVIGNFFLGLNKPSYPLKIFQNVNDATGWLKGFFI
ncbi:MAG: STAS/SEC14 domain-containing protein [Nitrospinota bacterium]|nr:STAS/SEC14 domain-containing protein [Nitrospinota bacterium]